VKASTAEKLTSVTALNNGPNRIGVSLFQLRTETDPVSETLSAIVFIIPDDGKKIQKPVIMNVTALCFQRTRVGISSIITRYIYA
jgi:hypothetical protein